MYIRPQKRYYSVHYYNTLNMSDNEEVQTFTAMAKWRMEWRSIFKELATILRAFKEPQELDVQ
jgi:hypothetical protein